MRRRFLVIGLGRFGASIATELARRGMDVTAVDSSQDLVEQIAADVSRAIVADATDQQALEELRVDSFDVTVNALGSESLEASILCTALLRQLGARSVIARSTGKLHQRILYSLGVERVVEPESFVGDRLAQQLAAPGLVGQLDAGEGVTIAEVEVPEKWVGKSLSELDLRRKLSVTVVALRRQTEDGRSILVPSPRPDVPLRRKDVALILGSDEEIERLLEELK